MRIQFRPTVRAGFVLVASFVVLLAGPSSANAADCTEPVPDAGCTITSTSSPTVNGSTAGTRVTVTTGAWLPTDATLAYQWQRGYAGAYTDLDGATAEYYDVPASMAGFELRVRVTASKSGYTSGAVTSAPVAITVLALPDPPAPPCMVGHTGTPPNCVDPTAPVLTCAQFGMLGTYPDCSNPVPACAPDEIGTPPECRAKNFLDRAQEALGALYGKETVPVAAFTQLSLNWVTAFRPASHRTTAKVLKNRTLPLASVQVVKTVRLTATYVITLDPRNGKPVTIRLPAKVFTVSPDRAVALAPKLTPAQLHRVKAAKAPKVTVGLSYRYGTKTHRSSATVKLTTS